MSDPILVPLENMNTSNPIVVGVERNVAMGAFDVVLIVGNFKDKHKAETAARHIVRLVEDELGSQSVKPAKGN